MAIYDKASLVLIPSGTKTSKVYSQKPTNGDGDFTFSRSTAATRVNASGNIEKETENLLLQSNTLDTTWGATAGTMTGGQADKDGGTSAWKFEATNSGQSRFNQTISVSGVNTISMYAKAGTANFLCLYIIGSGDPRAFFNLSTGAVGSTGSSIDANIEDVGNGWYRCSLTFDRTSSTLWCFVSNTDGNFNSAIGDNIYIQDAQLEQGLVARDYIETTTTAIYGGITDNVPRLDYTDSSCPALLLEPQRTNSVTQSEYFDGGNLQNSGISADYNTADTLSPEGLYNAAKLTATGTFPRYNDYPTIADNLNIVMSNFVKQGSASVVALSGNDKSGNFAEIWFDLSNGTATANVSSTLSSYNYDIEDYGNGWYRIWLGFNTGSGATAMQYRIINHANSQSGGWTGANYIYAYGAQFEQDATYPTSYIPTYGSAVTRNADSYYNNNMASLYDSANGFCLYFEYADVKRGDNAFFDYFSFQQLPNTDTGFRAEAAGANNLEWRIYTDNIDSDLGFPMRVSNIESKSKVLMKVETTGIKLFADGSLEDSQSGYVVIPTLGTLQPSRSTAQPALTQIKQSLGQILYLPVLSDEECIDLTTI